MRASNKQEYNEKMARRRASQAKRPKRGTKWVSGRLKKR